MAINGAQAFGLAVIGVAGWGYGLVSIGRGRINLGGKGRDAIVAFADQPVLFLAGLVLVLVLASGALAIAWRHFTRGPS